MREVRRLGLVLVAIVSGLTPIGAAEDPSFMSLFDGKTLEGWSTQSTDRFSVRNELLFADGGTGWLKSDKRYKNFEFRAEYRALKAGADTGIFFRASEKSTDNAPHWPSKCYELQISDSDNHLTLFGHGTTVQFERHSDLVKSVSKPLGEWQALRLTVNGGHATVHFNDALVTESNVISLDEGHLGIQGENGQFEWRGLKIRELP